VPARIHWAAVLQPGAGKDTLGCRIAARCRRGYIGLPYCWCSLPVRDRLLTEAREGLRSSMDFIPLGAEKQARGEEAGSRGG